jgi:chromosome segregation ATPase
MKRIAALLFIAFYAPLASAVYKCVDDKGHVLFGDTPPAACGNVPIYELTPSGTVLRRIDPTPTPQQLELMREERERKKKEERLAAEQRRKDMALLNTYSSANEFDVARDRNIEPVEGRITAASERMKELDQREAQINARIQTYEDKPGKDGKAAEPPAWLTEDLARVRSERTSLTNAIERYRKEVDDLRKRFDTDKRRWIALKAAAGSLPPPAEAKPAEAEPVKAPAQSHRRLGS